MLLLFAPVCRGTVDATSSSYNVLFPSLVRVIFNAADIPKCDGIFLFFYMK
ncbi:hypothetical protein STA3757_21300 [Stanieria sp. NIES-3757]|nr:hypothetical protein STA3757_21300 [Stanieria sp. NIES-3757]